MKCVVFGGSFDPIHEGHLAAADAVQNSMAIDELIWLPSWHAVHKLDVKPAAGEFRAQCIASLLLNRNPNEQLSRIEIDSQQPCFTVNTLAKLQAENPSREIYFLLGGDSLSHLNTWHDLPALFASCRFLLVPRPGWGQTELECYRQQLTPKLRDCFQASFVDMDAVDVSSSDIRAAIAAKQPPRGLPLVVAELIQSHQVYSSL